MLEVAVDYERVFDRLDHEDSGYQNSFSNGKVIGAPGYNDWEAARRLIPFSKPFYDATTALSGSTYVTISHYFCQFQIIRDHLKRAQTNNYKVVAAVAVETMVKYDQYFGNLSKVNMLVYVALVLDPRSKLEVFKRGLAIAFDEATSKELFEGTKKLLQELYESYLACSEAPQSQLQVSQIAQTTETSFLSSSSVVTCMWDIVCDENEYTTSISRSEIDKYFADNRERPSTEFDLLMFWKVMEGRFPILAAIARDLYGVPASTVASKSVFSTGGRVITDRRSSLLPRTVEALLCTQSWLKNVVTIDYEEEILDDEDAQEVEKIAEEELDGGATSLGDSLNTSRSNLHGVTEG